jgi:hypothetical protein
MTTLPPPENSGPASVNPYAPPESALAGAEPLDAGGDLAEAEATRRAYLNHEASVQSIGSLHYIAAFFGFLGTLGLIASLALRVQPDSQTMLTLGFVTGFYLVLSSLHLPVRVRIDCKTRIKFSHYETGCQSGSFS